MKSSVSFSGGARFCYFWTETAASPVSSLFSVTVSCTWDIRLCLIILKKKSEKVTDSPEGFLFYFVFSLLNFFLFNFRNERRTTNISVFQFPVCHPKLIMSTPTALFSVSADFQPLFDCCHLSKCHTHFIFSRVPVCTFFSSSLALLQ